MPVNLSGILVALCSYLVIGLFHPIVIKCEYHFSHRVWPVFLVCGLALLAAALLTQGLVSILLGLVGASCLWSIHELKEQT